jgi:hypothetical protein
VQIKKVERVFFVFVVFAWNFIPSLYHHTFILRFLAAFYLLLLYFLLVLCVYFLYIYCIVKMAYQQPNNSNPNNDMMVPNVQPETISSLEFSPAFNHLCATSWNSEVSKTTISACLAALRVNWQLNSFLFRLCIGIV